MDPPSETLAAARAFNAQRWKSLYAKLTAGKELPGLKQLGQIWWSAIDAAYAEGKRHYHNHNHLYELFTKADKCASIEDRESVDLAIFFHDLVYDVIQGAPANENQSADAFLTFAREFGEVGDRAELGKKIRADPINQWIRATASHDPALIQEQDGREFLRCDLSILASGEARYMQYAEEIRREYTGSLSPSSGPQSTSWDFWYTNQRALGFLTPDMFTLGRAGFLKLYLGKDHKVFDAAMNAQAKQNMGTELVALEKDVTGMPPHRRAWAKFALRAKKYTSYPLQPAHLGGLSVLLLVPIVVGAKRRYQ